MCKLLRAHFYRLRRSRALWLCMAAAFALSALFQLRIGADNESMNTLDVIFLQVFPFLPILLANQELAHPAVSLCASVGIVLLSGAVGMAIFKRKDLK